MFENTRLLGIPRAHRKIIVQTREGTDLENFIGPQEGVQCCNRFAVLCRKHGAQWQIRKPATGGYNCAGMVWASRRAVLPDPADWERILVEDGYRLLRADETAELGDIVVYRAEGGDEILHVGRVCRLKKLQIPEAVTTPVPMALSKWDLTSGEVIHAIRDVFLNGGEPFSVSLYTDRPHQ